MLDHTKNPCSEDFVPKEKVHSYCLFCFVCLFTFFYNMQDKIFVFYFFMEHAKHFDHWMKLAKVRQCTRVQARLSVTCSLQCFNLWDLDARGFHKVE